MRATATRIKTTKNFTRYESQDGGFIIMVLIPKGRYDPMPDRMEVTVRQPITVTKATPVDGTTEGITAILDLTKATTVALPKAVSAELKRVLRQMREQVQRKEKAHA